jgi:FAD/FMN-containing dehydrogenase
VSDGRTLVPASLDEVVATVRELRETSTPFAVLSGDQAGGGSRVVVSLARLTGVALRASSLTLRAEAGTRVSEVLRAAGDAKLAVVGMDSRVAADRHVGSLIARGEVPRRAVAGIEAVLPTGETVRTGGSVLKDVVGYDLPALLLGSMGRLAVITAVTFRLEPAGARTPSQSAPGIMPEHSGPIVVAFNPQGLLRPLP